MARPIIPIIDPKLVDQRQKILSAARANNHQLLPSLIKTVDGPGRASALIEAVKNNHQECVVLLLPHVERLTQAFAFNIAAEYNHANIVKELAPYCVGVPYMDTVTAIQWSVGHQNKEMFHIVAPNATDDMLYLFRWNECDKQFIVMCLAEQEKTAIMDQLAGDHAARHNRKM